MRKKLESVKVIFYSSLGDSDQSSAAGDLKKGCWEFNTVAKAAADRPAVSPCVPFELTEGKSSEFHTTHPACTE